MRSCSSASAPGRLSNVTPVCLLAPGLLDAAVDQLMIRRDFQASFDSCEKGLQSLVHSEVLEENWSRHGELKAALCIVGIQALAELNQWSEVHTWVLRHYDETEKIPAKIMQMCILLYTKVAEQTEMQELVQTWLQSSSNMRQPGYSSVAELYTLHFVQTLDQTTEATEEMEDKGEVSLNEVHKVQGSLAQRLNSVVKLFYRGLSTVGANIRSHSLRQAFLLLFLLYLLLVRMDPVNTTGISIHPSIICKRLSSSGSRWVQSLPGIIGRKAGIHPGGGTSPSQGNTHSHTYGHF
ncbi:peroxisome assembly protein 26 isoform X1 [Hoplias malabaricus]|uniref:peroxisome assembly protein 26 isoform X1 n=1 Tax=Hoplias malabaricus TaxID=27720 RepID=UPI0034627622